MVYTHCYNRSVQAVKLTVNPVKPAIHPIKSIFKNRIYSPELFEDEIALLDDGYIGDFLNLGRNQLEIRLR